MTAGRWRMGRKSGHWFCEKDVRKQRVGSGSESSSWS